MSISVRRLGGVVLIIGALEVLATLASSAGAPQGNPGGGRNPATPPPPDPHIIWGVIERGQDDASCQAKYHEIGWRIRKTSRPECVIEITKPTSLAEAAVFYSVTRYVNANQDPMPPKNPAAEPIDLVVNQGGNTITVETAPRGSRIAFQILTASR